MGEFFPLLVFLGVAIGMGVVTTALPHFIGPRKSTRIKDMPYESGMDPVGSARQPLDINFYLIAILLIVFDVELLFLLPWAVSLRSEGGIPADQRPAVLVVMLLLLATLGIAYAYAWRKGIFDWRRR